jgi:hypothetical protein
MNTSEQKRNDAIELHQENAIKLGLMLHHNGAYYVDVCTVEGDEIHSELHWSDINGFLIGWNYN